MKRQLALGLAISVLALWLSMKDVDFHKMLGAVARAQFVWLIPAMLFTLLGYLVRSYRWKFLLLSIKDIPVRDLFSSTIVGFFANVVLPARLGEIIRPFLLGRRQGISKTASFATIVVERVFDLSTLMACFGIVLIFYPHSFTPALRRIGITMFGANLAAMVLLFLMQAHSEATLRAARRVVRPFPAGVGVKLVQFLDAFMDGLGAFRHGHHMARVILLSLAMWATIAMSVWCTQASLHMPLPLYASAVLVVVISVGIMAPSAPGYIGVMQLACLAGLGIFKIDNVTALAFSWLYLFTQHVPVIAAGVVCMWRENLSFSDLTHAGVEGKATP